MSVVLACLQTDTKFVGHTARIINVEPSTVAIKHKIGGTVTITDGCRFSIRNMTIVPSGNGLYFWGIPSTNNTEDYPRIVTAGLGAFNGQTQVWQLDPQYSFDNFSIIAIYSEGDSRAYGAFSITGNVSAYYGLNGNSADASFDFDSMALPRFKISSRTHAFIVLLVVIVIWGCL